MNIAIVAETAPAKTLIPIIEKVDADILSLTHSEGAMELLDPYSREIFSIGEGRRNTTKKRSNFTIAKLVLKDTVRTYNALKKKGEFVSIMGASGSGKSTLLNILGILDSYDTGEYRIDGKLIKNLSEKTGADYRNRMIGFIFQSYNLIGFKTAVENVELPLFYQGIGRHRRRELAMEYLERMGLTDWASHFPNEMSGGQKQRVAIARALVTNPAIILADEPTGALDSKTSVEIMDLLGKLNREEKMTIIVVTHESGVANAADKIIHIKDGVIGSIEENSRHDSARFGDGSTIK